MTKNTRVIILIAVTSVLVVGGCTVFAKTAGREMTKRLMEKMTGIRVEESGEEHTYETDEGTLTTGKSIPADWPSDVPVYPAAIIELSGTMDSMAGDGGMALMLLATADVQEVKNYYRTELVEQGWTVKNTLESERSTVYLAEKNGRTMSATVTGTDGAVNITIGLQIKKS